MEPCSAETDQSRPSCSASSRSSAVTKTAARLVLAKTITLGGAGDGPASRRAVAATCRSVSSSAAGFSCGGTSRNDSSRLSGSRCRPLDSARTASRSSPRSRPCRSGLRFRPLPPLPVAPAQPLGLAARPARAGEDALQRPAPRLAGAEQPAQHRQQRRAELVVEEHVGLVEHEEPHVAQEQRRLRLALPPASPAAPAPAPALLCRRPLQQVQQPAGRADQHVDRARRDRGGAPSGGRLVAEARRGQLRVVRERLDAAQHLPPHLAARHHHDGARPLQPRRPPALLLLLLQQLHDGQQVAQRLAGARLRRDEHVPTAEDGRALRPPAPPSANPAPCRPAPRAAAAAAAGSRRTPRAAPGRQPGRGRSRAARRPSIDPPASGTERGRWTVTFLSVLVLRMASGERGVGASRGAGGARVSQQHQAPPAAANPHRRPVAALSQIVANRTPVVGSHSITANGAGC